MLGVEEGAVPLGLDHFVASIGCEGICSGPEEKEWDLFLSMAEQDFNGLVEVILYCKGS